MSKSESRGLNRIAKVCVVRFLIPTRVTSGHLTSARLIVALLAALALALGPQAFHWAAGLLAIAIVLDRSDGELALARDEFSPTGQRYAFICDGSSHALVLTGLGVGLRGGEYGLAAIAMGLIAGLCVAALPWLIRRLESIDGRASDEFAGFAGLSAEEVLLLTMPLALLAGWAEGLLIVTAFVAPTFLTAFYLTHYRKFSASS